MERTITRGWEKPNYSDCSSYAGLDVEGARIAEIEMDEEAYLEMAANLLGLQLTHEDVSNMFSCYVNEQPTVVVMIGADEGRDELSITIECGSYRGCYILGIDIEYADQVLEWIVEGNWEEILEFGEVCTD